MRKERTLNELGLKYGTDKSSLLHDYLKAYEPFFTTSPNNVTSMAEIGLQRGGKWRNQYTLPSLEMWGEFFPEAKLFGFDIKDLKTDNERITLFKGDQGNLHDLRCFSNMIGEVDFIIDDGSHKPTHQMATLITLWKNLKNNGIYIIEDCNAVVQGEYPKDCRIHSLIAPYLSDVSHYWIDSKSAGVKSSLVIIKPGIEWI